ncbi:MAG: YncE family protein, partial [Planctomycetota bacterium]
TLAPSGLLLCSAAALAQNAGEGPGRELQLIAVEGRSDPNSLAWDRTNGRVALGNGTRVELWQDEPAGLGAAKPLAGFDVDRTLLALELSDERLFVAAGTGGLLRVDHVLDPAARSVAVIDVQERPCVALDLRDELVWALFSGLDDNRVRAFDAATGEPRASIEVDRGIGQDLLFDGVDLWVSAGTAGVARVRKPLGPEPRLEWCIDPAAHFPDAEAPGFPRTFGELARGAHHLFVAGDDLGVVGLGVSPNGELRGEPFARPLRIDGRPSYVSSLSAEPERGLLAVGSNRGPRAAALGAPYGVLGWLDHRFSLGGIDPSAFEHGTAEGLSLFVESADGLKLNAQSSQPAADWRGLRLGGTVLFEQHTGRGARRTRVAPGELHRPRATRPLGFAPVDVEVSLSEPGRLRLGLDPAGSVAPGSLRYTPGRGLVLDEGSDAPANFGLFVGDPWLDETGAEWFLAGGGLELKLWRRAPNGPLQSWPLELPADARGRRGHTYFGAAKLDDLLVISRAQCDTGILLVHAPTLLRGAAAEPSGTPLSLLGCTTLETRAGRETFDGTGDPLDYAWSPSLGRDAADRILCLVPAGLGHVERGAPARCLLFDLTDWRLSPVGEPVVLEAPAGPGHALDAELVTHDGSLHALVGDLVQGVHVFALSDDREPRWLHTWAAPVSIYDGHRPNLFDLEWRADHEELWVAYGRAGAWCYRADDLDEGLALTAVLDTPGLAFKLTWAEVHGADTLFVGDQKGGLRVYR